MSLRGNIWLLFILFGIAACTDPKVLTRHANGIPRLMESKKFFGNSLIYEVFDSVGRMEAMYEVRDSQLHGAYRKYYPNGQLALDQYFVKGKLDGYERSYYDNGTKKTTGYFKGGLAEGVAMGWFDDGRMSDSAVYRNGLVQGLVTAYYINGNLYSHGFYRNDTPVGLHVDYTYQGDTQSWILFDSTGSRVEVKRFKK